MGTLSSKTTVVSLLGDATCVDLPLIAKRAFKEIDSKWFTASEPGLATMFGKEIQVAG
jgi:SpoVK/Ycf46/Vps4 family AAA+-type ATPase